MTTISEAQQLPSDVIERGFQLASSGRCQTVTAIKARLKLEGYSQIDSHLSGRGLQRRLKEVIKASHVES